MFPITYDYNPKQTVWSVDPNNFLITELVIVDVRAKVFPQNTILHQQIKYNTKNTTFRNILHSISRKSL